MLAGAAAGLLTNHDAIRGALLRASARSRSFPTVGAKLLADWETATEAGTEPES